VLGNKRERVGGTENRFTIQKKTLTQVAALVVDLELPDADWRLTPAVHRHERPPVEARTGHVQTSPVQQGRSRAPRRGQVDLQITPPASCQGDFRLKSSRHARVLMLKIILDKLAILRTKTEKYVKNPHFSHSNYK
jgi:hypothetical protein